MINQVPTCGASLLAVMSAHCMLMAVHTALILGCKVGFQKAGPRPYLRLVLGQFQAVLWLNDLPLPILICLAFLLHPDAHTKSLNKSPP